jgi:serine/threonine protein kinase
MAEHDTNPNKLSGIPSQGATTQSKESEPSHHPTGSMHTDDYTPETVAPATQTRQVGPSALGSRYRIDVELARGGMGVVYTATDTIFDRLVAIKVLAPKLVGTSSAKRFIREARITGRLQHPSIPPVHDLGTLDDGEPYLAMKLIRGQTFAATIKAARAADEAHVEEFDRLIQIFEQICLAVAFAHSRRVIHRDLKPQNVMVGAFGEIQVMDWGLAKELDSTVSEEKPETHTEFHDDPDERTMTGNVMGTPSYMPPEQARGETHVIDERADVFSLGAILCVILTGKPPYLGKDGHAVWEKASQGDLEEALTRLNQVRGQGRLVALAKRCLQLERSARPAHAGEVAAAVRVERDWVARTKQDEMLNQATYDANQTAEEARQRFRSAIRITLVVIAVAAWVSYVAWQMIPGQNSTPYIPETSAPAILATRKAEAPDQLYDLESAIARGMENGRFAPNWDGPYRERMWTQLDRVQPNLTSPLSHRARLLGVAMMDANRSPEAESRWYTAVEEYRKQFPDHAQYRFALQIVDWFGQAKPFTVLERTLLKRAQKVLVSRSSTELPADLVADIDKARARLEELGIKLK